MLECEENRNDIMHGFTSLHDQFIQERLLEADEEILTKEILNLNNSSSSQIKSFRKNDANSEINALSSGVLNSSENKSKNAQKLLREFRIAPLCGWYIDPDVVYRRSNINTGPSKSKGPLGKEYSSSRELKNKINTSQDYIFQHYTDINLYIEQYRQEHVCCDATSLQTTKNDLLESRRPQIGSEYTPLTVCSEITTSEQSTTQPSTQQVSSLVHNIKQQLQTHQKSQQCLTGQYVSKLEQQRQAVQARTLKKLHLPTSTSEIGKDVFVPEQYHVAVHSERVSSAKVSAFTKAVSDGAIKKTEFTVMKLPTSKIVPTKIVNLVGPGSPLDSDNRRHDSFADSSGSGSEKETVKLQDCPPVTQELPRLLATDNSESVGVQTIQNIPKAQLELCTLVNEQPSKPEPSQPFMTCKHEKDWLQTSTKADCGRTLQATQPMLVNNIGSDAPEKDIIDTSEKDVINATGKDVIAAIEKNVIAAIEKNVIDNSLYKNATGRPNLETGQIFEQTLSRKERSLMNVTGQDYCNTKIHVYDHWTVAKQRDEKSYLSQNKRIRHLINQSRLKYKFEPNLNQSKPLFSRRFLEINSIQIADPFVKAVPCNNQIRSTENCEQNIDKGLCSCCTEATISSNSVQDNAIGVKSKVKIVQNGNPQSNLKIPNSFFLAGFDCFTSSDHFTKTNLEMSHCKKNCYKSGADKVEQYKGGQRSSKHRHLGRGNMNTNCGQTTPNTTLENALENCLQLNKPIQISKDKCYIHKLANEVSTMVTFSVPKMEYTQFPVVYRSQSLEF